MLVKKDAHLLRVLEFQHVTPGKGHAFVQTKMRNLRSGTLSEQKFASGDFVERAILDSRKMQYLYADGDGYYFMDTENSSAILTTENRAHVGISRKGILHARWLGAGSRYPLPYPRS